MTKKKKFIISIISILLVIVLGFVGVIVISLKTPPKVISLTEKGLPTDGVNLVAHRGFSAVAPENSSAARSEERRVGKECPVWC